MNKSPFEETEQIQLVQWLELKGLKFTAIPNSTYSKSWSVKARNKRTGVRAGLPDLLILLPSGILFIELKRQQGGVVSAVQKDWIAAINATPGAEAHVAKGCSEAIKIIEEYL